MQEQSLNVLQHGLEYLQACYIPDPSGYGSQYGDVYVYQVGDVKREMRFWRRPEDIEVRPQPPLRSSEGLFSWWLARLTH